MRPTHGGAMRGQRKVTVRRNGRDFGPHLPITRNQIGLPLTRSTSEYRGGTLPFPTPRTWGYIMGMTTEADSPLDSGSQNWVADRFEIRELIGSGGLGDVYRALDHQLGGRPVAIKRVRMQVNQNDRRLVEQTWREAMTTACLQHPNIVTIFDYGIDAQGAYVVMELIEGETLEDVLVRGPLQFEDFFLFAQQSLHAIVAAHALGLIHRDLKPGNFMVARGGR